MADIDTQTGANDLVQRAGTDADALGRLYDMYYERIFKFCVHRLFVRDAAEEVTSEIFLNVAQNIGVFMGVTEHDFANWLYAIAINHCNSHVRKSARRKKLFENVTFWGGALMWHSRPRLWSLICPIDGDTVIVAPGTYGELVYIGSLTITLRSIDPNDPAIVASTIINNNDISYGILCETNSVISGFTITNCFCGINCYGASPTITNCVITGNSARSWAGGISCTNASPSISNCVITNNTTIGTPVGERGWGGGISCENNSCPQITDCIISDNKAGNCGGGIACVTSSNPQIINCTISRNQSGKGGGVFSNRSQPTIKDCTISANAAGYGGGIFTGIDGTGTMGGDTPIILNCLINKNHAGYGGGVYGRYGRSMTNCTVIDRRVTQGTRGDAGMRWCERIWTTIATCKKQGRNVFDFIHQSILAHWTKQPYPQLL